MIKRNKQLNRKMERDYKVICRRETIMFNNHEKNTSVVFKQMQIKKNFPYYQMVK